MQWYVEPEEIADLIVFLCSDFPLVLAAWSKEWKKSGLIHRLTSDLLSIPMIRSGR